MLTIDQCNLLGKATQGFDENPEVALEHFKKFFDRVGPYQAAVDTSCLVNGSGEELAIAFMTMYNIDHPGTY